MAFETQSEEQFSDNKRKTRNGFKDTGFKEAVNLRESQDLVLFNEQYENKSRIDDNMSVT